MTRAGATPPADAGADESDAAPGTRGADRAPNDAAEDAAESVTVTFPAHPVISAFSGPPWLRASPPGEVVERPASAAKELIENALDAQARRIEIDVEGGGIDRLVVADDGVGVRRNKSPPHFDVTPPASCETMKSWRRIGTLGFRGEALPSIAVRVLHMTCTDTNRSRARRNTANGKLWTARRPLQMARGVGTTVIVEDLFLQHYAGELQFLRGRAAEAAP